MAKDTSLFVIDDNINDIKYLSRILTSEKNISIDYSLTGTAGLQKIQKNSYDCIIIDYNLPDYSIQDLIPKISTLTNSATPLIVITGMGDEEAVTLSFRLGAKNYISKNNIVNLRDTIYTTISKHKEELIFKKNIKKYKYLALHDKLTALPNRTSLLDKLKAINNRLIRYNELYAVLFIDLDGFKQINDQYGHSYGDMLLKEVATRLLNNNRNTDIVSRLSGDEFIVILTNTANHYDIKKIASKIIHELAKPYILDKIKVNISASIGINYVTKSNNDIKLELQKADKAMYLAKNSGKNKYCFYSDNKTFLCIDDHDQKHDQGNDYNDQFSILVQPTFNIRENYIFGVESYIYKINEKRKIYAKNFIQEAALNGVILQLDKLSLEHSQKISQTIKQKLNLNIPFYVNISYETLLHGSIINLLDINNNLFLELDESFLYEKMLLQSKKICEMSERGINFGIDNFGCSYMSIKALYELPLKYIKIRAELVFKHPSLINDLAAVSKSCNFKIIVTYVETKEQFKLLQNKNVSLLQGNYLSSPLTTTPLITMIEESII